MKLIPNASSSWKLWSMQAMTVVAVMQTVWASIDATTKASLPPSLVNWLSVVVLVAGIVARVIQQTNVALPSDDDGDTPTEPAARPDPKA
jgi:hypothetical protein